MEDEEWEDETFHEDDGEADNLLAEFRNLAKQRKENSEREYSEADYDDEVIEDEVVEVEVVEHIVDEAEEEVIISDVEDLEDDDLEDQVVEEEEIVEEDGEEVEEVVEEEIIEESPKAPPKRLAAWQLREKARDTPRRDVDDLFSEFKAMAKEKKKEEAASKSPKPANNNNRPAFPRKQFTKPPSSTTNSGSLQVPSIFGASMFTIKKNQPSETRVSSPPSPRTTKLSTASKEVAVEEEVIEDETEVELVESDSEVIEDEAVETEVVEDDDSEDDEINDLLKDFKKMAQDRKSPKAQTKPAVEVEEEVIDEVEIIEDDEEEVIDEEEIIEEDDYNDEVIEEEIIEDLPPAKPQKLSGWQLREQAKLRAMTSGSTHSRMTRSSMISNASNHSVSSFMSAGSTSTAGRGGGGIFRALGGHHPPPQVIIQGAQQQKRFSPLKQSPPAKTPQTKVSSSPPKRTSSSSAEIVRWVDLHNDPDDLKTACEDLMEILYSAEDGVDTGSMMRRTPLRELYRYLKQQYWYKVHSGEIDQDQSASQQSKEAQRKAKEAKAEETKNNLNALFSKPRRQPPPV